MAADEISPDNAAQQTFWTEGPGLNWVTLREELDTLHADLSELVLAAAAPRPGERVIDLGCGAGATTLALAEAVGPDGHVTGLDVSSTLLEVARTRAAGLEGLRPEFIHTDVQVWEPEQPADLCMSRMGVMFFADPVAAFANILRFLRPGGRLAFICWRAREENPWFDLPMKVAVDHLGPAAPGDPDAPGPMAFRDPERVRGILASAGFADIAMETVAAELRLPRGMKAADLATRVGPAVRHMRDMGATEAQAQAIQDGIHTAFAPFEASEGAKVPARMNLVTARRP
ncbi:methyltransferase domain-containing protein [Yangia mangrovi]|uniref:Methyltransferase domain-containing protein n=1 Tax=Alloyangia mangrovi TaxID=1779329 RepID=A0A2A3JS80_9RHOB|nr:class I SAM-dependent methyltransferase [Alloyangia mangrovi]MCA0942940.1 class I SAM-dependent methyltransferase [Alloyangia pacifica]MCA0944142.1 class I SAM-dependent methyltransferase [Alloyangia pacifica]MCT4370001.1 methyltransferase domain-containing protein [Alloyangia mangrovi]